MKKLLALTLTGMMAFSMGTIASAEAQTEAEPEIIEFDYNEIDEDLYEGTWVVTGLGFDMYLPSDWAVVEQEEDSPVVFQAGDAETGANVAITYAEDAGLETTEDLAASLEEQGFTGLQYVDMSGILGVGFDVDEKNVAGVAFLDEDGALYSVILGPVNDEKFSPIALNIFQSISPSEDAETETE